LKGVGSKRRGKTIQLRAGNPASRQTGETESFLTRNNQGDMPTPGCGLNVTSTRCEKEEGPRNAPFSEGMIPGPVKESNFGEESAQPKQISVEAR